MNKYYKILGVTEESTKEEIKSAHRNLLKKYHPDTYLGDKNFAAKKSAEINVAYAQVLADREKNGFAQPKSQTTQQKNEPKQSKKAKTEPKKDLKKQEEHKAQEQKTRRQPYEEPKTEVKPKKENTYQKQEKIKKDVNFAEYAARVAENSEVNISDLYMSKEEIKNDLKAKHILDALIISLSVITIILILMFIFL